MASGTKNAAKQRVPAARRRDADTMRASLLAAPLLALGASCGGGDGAGEVGRGVLVIAVDALRADHLSALGYDRETTPRLERFARRGVLFANAWSSAPEMTPAHVTLLTGCYPEIARMPPLPDGSMPISTWSVPGDVPRLAQEFLASGWRTAAFVDHAGLGETPGLSQGFQTYEDPGDAQRAGDNWFGIEGVGRRFVDWLRRLEHEEEWFAYLHLNDLDRMWGGLEGELEPRFPPRGSESVPPVSDERPIFFAVPRSRWDGEAHTLGEYESLYDTALWHLDVKLSSLLEELRRRGRLDCTTVAIVGSFGFGFGESGLVVDNGSLSDVDLHVPLYVHVDQSVGYPIGREVRELVSTVDLAPTLLDLAQISKPAGMHGRSLVPLIWGPGTPGGSTPPVREEAYASSALYPGFAVVDRRFCYEYAEIGARPSRLALSWYGLDRPTKDEADFLREGTSRVLHDRDSDPRPGHLRRGVDDEQRAQSMHARGEAWRALVLRARDVLHRVPWREARSDPEELAELRRLGMIGDLPP